MELSIGMKKISLIVPVYNVEDFVARCLNSLLEQNMSYEDYEIIIVNDGSTDSSLEIIQPYLEKYPNCKLIDKPNGGLSSARNAGLNVALGEYIWFVDSDDFIMPNLLDDLYKECSSNDLDVLWMEWRRVSELGIELHVIFYFYTYNKTEVILSLIH